MVRYYDINICNISIPDFENWLDKSKEDLIKKTYIISDLYGTAISFNNIQIIALLNLFVKENNVIINKTEVLESIYHADCRQESARNKDCLIKFRSFDDIIKKEYEDKYIKIFYTKSVM
jgi:predicted metal-binding protein